MNEETKMNKLHHYYWAFNDYSL